MRINELPHTQLRNNKVNQSLAVILVLGVEVFMTIIFFQIYSYSIQVTTVTWKELIAKMIRPYYTNIA